MAEKPKTPEAGHSPAPAAAAAASPPAARGDAAHGDGHSAEKTGESKATAAKNAAMAKLKSLGGLGKGLLSAPKTLVVGLLKAPFTILGLLFKGELSTRVLMLGFIASLILLGRTSVQIYKKFIAPHFIPGKAAKTEEGSAISKFMAAQRELQIAEANVAFLDKFTAALGGPKLRAHAFEVEIYLECDSPETSKLVKARAEALREVVSGALQGQEYDVLMTDEGKEALRNKVAALLSQKLRQWKPGAEIKHVFFTHFHMA